MKKLLIGLIAISICMHLTGSPVEAQAAGKTIKAVLAYHPVCLQQAPQLLAAYESVLQEEGVPYESADINSLAGRNPVDAVKTIPVVIMPDGLLQITSPNFVEWVKRYVASGGNIAVIYDAGVKNEQGFFLDKGAFADIIGLNYITYSTAGAAAYDLGNIRFSSEERRDFFEIPIGKTVERLTVSSYNYGALTYPIARNEPLRELPESSIYAYGVTAKNEKYPLLVLSNHAKGRVLYVNLPLGYLKGYSDDLPMRSVLRTFLFDIIAMPHIMNVEQGLGGLVINWHVDSEVEHMSLPYLLDNGYLRKSINSSYHICAGDFFLKPHDGLGFEAAGRGRELILKLKEYGTVGSHGGWAHNWFSDNINSGKFGEKEIYQYIKKNNDLVASITGYPVTEYAAPNGAHPQPAATRALEALGVVAYYYTGDSGSAPNRTFSDGKMVTENVIAFPIMPFGKTASIYESYRIANRSDSEVKEWFFATLDYIKRNRIVRMIYSHPYDIQYYPKVYLDFVDKVELMQTNKEIIVRPMTDVSRWMFRFLKTRYEFERGEKQTVVSLSNPQGLRGVTIAMPKQHYAAPLGANITIQDDERYYYVTVAGNAETQKLVFHHK